MNDYLLAIILGIVEGVTEFLPVSSTAHLRLAQHFAGVSLDDEYWKLFAVFIQLGAILAVMALYRARLLGFFADTRRPGFFGVGFWRQPSILIGVAFVCTAVPAFLLSKLIGENLESLGVMVGSLFVGGVVMIAVDMIFASRGRVSRVEEMRLWQAVFVGLVQVLSAVFPGTSRSMSTIAAGQVAGLSRSASLEFSFLVSIPIMIVATLYDLLKYVRSAEGFELSGHQAGVLAVGLLVSFLVAYVVVAWFLRYVRTRGFTPFGLYRIAAAAALWWWVG
jgi:undecaprenyl-diphosphatase